MVSSEFNIRPANPSDYQALLALTGFEFYVHRHLDWKSPLDWLGSQPFFVLENDQRILAALACPEDPPTVAWIHLFATNSSIKPQVAFPTLFSIVFEYLQKNNRIEWIPVISLQTWLTVLLRENGFQHFQDIVVLEYEPSPQNSPPGEELDIAQLREMTMSDINRVAEVDRQAFHPIWQNTSEVMHEALNQGAYCMVAIRDAQIVGYQISTSSVYNAHLARLAVLPEYQRCGIGSFLIKDLVRHFYGQGVFRLTVNTQNDNKSSLNLYQKMGFQFTGDSYPVFLYPPALMNR